MKAICKRFSVLFLAATACFALVRVGNADAVVIRDAKVQHEFGDLYTFEVTLEHADEGWDHYAVGWEILGADGRVFGRRVLAHPHVDEQPFTRSLSGVYIPPGVNEVHVRAHDSVHGPSVSQKALQIDR